MSHHVHLDDADLLQWRLDPAGVERAAAAEAARCGACRARADELAADVSRARDAWLEASGAAEGEGRAARLAERVLALSTRSHPGIAGDVGLVLDFVRERLRMSLALRVAAASLAVHLAALPLLAWYALRSDARRGAFETSIEPPRAAELPAPAEPPRVPEITEPEPDTRLVETAAREMDSGRAARLADRARLLRKDVPDLTALEAPGERVARILWARSLRIHRGKLDAGLLEGSDAADPVANALAVEVLLDHWALAGERCEALDLRLHDLEIFGGSDPAAREISRAALERARRYSGFPGAARPPGEVDPLDAAWRRALGAACGARAEHAAVRAWIVGE